MSPIPELPVGQVVETAIDWLDENLELLFDFIALVLEFLYEALLGILQAPPVLIAVVVAAALAFFARGWKFALFSLLAFALVESMGLWESSMETMSMVLIAGAIAIVLALPVGVLAARNQPVSTVARPVLDFMQTLPPLVYLVPAIILFNIGVVPGMVATVIFAMPPGVRLTELGIRQVDKEMVEAGEAFGAAPRAILARIQLPLALPSIMAGINQVIMLSLSMVVLAGLVGAGGLGGVIFTALSTVDIGSGFEAGFAIVIIAVFLDRVTAALGNRSARRRQTAGAT